MALARFFIDADLVVGRRVDLPQAATHHAAHVLRLRNGDPVVVFNGRGGEFSARLVARATAVDLVEFDAVDRESPVALTLIQAWVALDKIDWVVEKAVELGVARILLAPARRSVVRVDGVRLARRVTRLRDIALSACCQSGRTRVPQVDAFDSLAGALGKALDNGERGVVLHPQSADSLVVLSGGARRLSIAVGPEGGFDDDELAAAEHAGYRPARIGPRVLRTETAGLAALSALQATAGDFR